MEIKQTCPLGSECEEIKNNQIHRCRWYCEISGVHPQTGKEISEWNCAVPLTLMATLEGARTNRGQTAALESFRNEMVSGNRDYAAAVNRFLMMIDENDGPKRLTQ